ncbi:MAG: heavy metal translocating P-type ATPase [Anaerolineae bacterium]
MEQTFRVTGLDCASCAQTLENGVAHLPGVQVCQVHFASGTLRVVGETPPDQIKARVRELGYDIAELAEQRGYASPPAVGWLRFMWQHHDTRLALLGLVLIMPSVVLEELLGIHHPFVTTLALGAWLSAGFPIVRSAWRALRINHDININVLMTIASLGAMVIGAFSEAGMVMVLFAIGEAFERYTGERARHAIRSLAELAPEQARLLRPHPGSASAPGQVAVTALRPGDVILVKPGERIPADGRVLSGLSAVNQAPITGESRPIEKGPGSEVFAGSINGEGALEVEVTRFASDTVLSRLIQLVQEAQERRATVQRFVDRFARVYTPAVVALAGLVAILPPLLFGQPFVHPATPSAGWLYRGLALLVIACPCALVISTPVSIISAISNAARHGVLIKGGAYLEMLKQVRAIAFDKTGTLTYGRPVVISVRPANHTGVDGTAQHCTDCAELLALASAVEQQSEHPLARAVVDEAARYGLHTRYPAATAVTALPGRGVTGRVEDREVMIGNHAYFTQNIAHSEDHCAAAKRDAQLGYTPLMVAADGRYIGMITVADTVRSTGREALEMLKKMGISTLVMLSGDDAAVGTQVGQQLGVTDVRAELMPVDKVAVIQSLRAQYGSVAMVGDGINDAPALATADVGIAIGAALGGTVQAMETADIVLLSDDLRRLPFLFALARVTLHTIQVNLALSIGLKTLFAALVLSGLGTMWMAVAADMGASLLVTLNGMRLLNTPRPPA